jgi:Cellulase (glycosyl hydrolase family 5)
MYRDPWDSRAVASDLNELAALGANVVRIFCFLPDFLPSPDVVSDKARERLEETIALAAQAKMWSIPTFLVGHMSGENWAPDWSWGKNWYSDPAILDASELLIGSIVSHFARDARIAAWLLTNEWPLFAGHTSIEESTRWAQRLLSVARAADPECNISTGDGAWDLIEGTRGGPNSASLRDLVDFFGPHFYPKEIDTMRHAAFASFSMKMVAPGGRPVLLEEFGCSSDQADDELAAAYYRTTLWSAFGAGNCGTLVWNSHDFSIGNRPPYSHHPYELHFGIIRTDGSRKPQGLEFERFAAYVTRLELDDWQPFPARAAIGRTSYYGHDFPFDWGWTKPQMRDIFLQAYGTSVHAGIDVSFVDLTAAQFGDLTTLLVPCLQQVTTNDAARIEKFARDGGTVYVSYGGEPWFPDFGRLIGARLLIRYGLVEDPGIACAVQLVKDFGDLENGTTLNFAIRGALRRRSQVLCKPETATVLATDARGEPALLEHQLGLGRVIFVTYPLEYYYLEGLDASRESDLQKVYRAVAVTGKALAPAWIDDPHVQLFRWQSRRNPNTERLLLVNHSWRPRTPTFVRKALAMRDIQSGETISERVQLDAKGVRLLEATGAA